MRLGFCDFNVIAVLSSLLPSLRYPLFALLFQRLLTLFSVLLFLSELNSGGGGVGAELWSEPQLPRIRRYVVLPLAK
ncbi:hypothetical protein [Plesiomonas shigelloides]|uniref:hypothetical protein n=1 Tax=Plesiomonas shigelloides TaxID=703 RepID=UPI003EBCD56E